jgi:Ca2+/H+ antiporter
MCLMENPLRSEAAMFRVVIVVAIAALPVIVVGLIAGSIYAVILLGIELIAGIVFLWRGLRATRSADAETGGGRAPRP